MANLNKVLLIGRLVNDPDPARTFQSGGKVIRFRFAVNYTRPRKNPTTGQWENESAFVDIEAFNSTREGGRQLADFVEQYLRKGMPVFVEGRLRLNEWTDKNGQKQSKLLVVADSIEFVEPRAGGEGGGMSGGAPRASGMAPRRQASPPPTGGGYEEPEPVDQSEPPQESDIPF